MRPAVDERLISRFQLVGTAIVVSVLVIGLGFFFIRQITEEHEVSIRALEAQQIQQSQDLLVRQIETAKGFMSNLRLRAEDVLKVQIREQVDQAYDIASTIYDLEKGKKSEAEIKHLIVESLRPLRFFGGKGYFFIDGMDGSCVLLPIGRRLEGTSLMENRDDTGHFIMRGLIEAAKRPVGEGYSRYRWFAPGDPREMTDKIAYVRLFQPFNWLIGTGQYVVDQEAVLKEEALDRLRSFRFGKDGSSYIAVIDGDERILVSPSRPWTEGKTVSESTEDVQVAGRPIVDQGRKGDGFIRYDWARNGGEGPAVAKLTYVSRLDDWGWTLSAGMYMDDITTATAERRAILANSIMDKIYLTIIALAIGVAVALGIGVWFSHLTVLLVGRYKGDLTRQNDELRKAARDLFLIHSMVESSAEMVFLADGDWTLIYANSFVQEQLGWNIKEMIGKAVSDVAGLVEKHSSDDGGGYSRFEAMFNAKDGRQVPVEVVAKDVEHDGALYHFVIARDITEHRQWEADLRAKTTALERSNTDLEQFAYVASHDLREPLRMVSSYLSLLERRYGEKLDHDGHEFLEFAREGAQRLDRLVLDLLEFSRIERRGSAINAIVARPVVDLAVCNLALSIEECGAQIQISETLNDAVVMGDSGQIARVFQNLIGNAIKYRAPDLVPKVSVDCTRLDAGWEFQISDNGIGIEPQYFDRIFGIFQRLHTRDKYEGTGIGLAICKKIIERHDGSISVESQPGTGTVFRFVLPAAKVF